MIILLNNIKRKIFRKIEKLNNFYIFILYTENFYKIFLDHRFVKILLKFWSFQIILIFFWELPKSFYKRFLILFLK